MSNPRVRALLLACPVLGLCALPAQTRLLRYPHLHGDTVVFVHGGDLWRAPAAGGDATRLTSHPGEELFPRFSPDGKWIAFTGQIDGDEQVYVIPAHGGVPRQLTFYPAKGPLPSRWGYDNQVVGWTPDSAAILFRGLRDAWSLTRSRLYTVKLAGGLPETLPMPISGSGSFSPDGRKIAYNPLVRDFRTWKRYEGGWAQDVFVFDLATHTQENVSNHKRTDRDPMWIGGSVWFDSDRTGTLNLFRYDLQSKQLDQVTTSEHWDVRWPAASSDGRIVYEMGGELWILDTRTKAQTKLAIEVPTDDLARRPALVDAGRQIEDASLSPKAERVAVSARGEVFSVPVEHGAARNLTRSPGAHDRLVEWSPDGRSIAFVSDRSGEEQIWITAQDGKGEPRPVTKDLKERIVTLSWSPDGSRIAFADKDGRLRLIAPEGGEITEVARETRGALTDFRWSPCGSHIAMALTGAGDFNAIWIWSKADGRLRRVTSELCDTHHPAWDPKGERLLALGSREFAPRIGEREWNYQIDRTTVVLAFALRKDLPALFPPRSDEVTVEPETRPTASGAAASEPGKDESRPATAKETTTKEATAKDDKAKGKEPIRIDFDGLADRVERVPGFEPEDWDTVAAVEGGLIVHRGTTFWYGRESDRKATLTWFDLKTRETKPLGEGIDGFEVARDGKKIGFAQDGAWYVMDARPGAEKKKVPTAGLSVERVPEQEWAQVFDEVWRRFRDYFYAPNMHGHDWEALRAQYRALLPSVSHRSDLNYLIGEMIAELNVGHAYITGGEAYRPTRVPVALPGCRFALDAASGRYRIAKILRGENDSAKYRAPLTEVGVDAREGDFVLAIDGVELRGDDNPYRLLRGRADRPVTLTLNDKPATEGARDVRFMPIASEEALVYREWVAANRQRVDTLSQGKVGYLHIPDMTEAGITEFIKWFYPQIRKGGLVIDVRNNGGGNVSQMIIERLRRKLMMMTYGRTTGASTNPNVVFHGHLVCLINENSASDGDIFPATFRRAGLGPLVGKRSWGGIVGITNRGPLMDGGTVNVPEFANTEPVGEWTIEGIGVVPDVEVENDPASVLAGRDPQLEKGVQILLEAIASKPLALPARPADPVRR